MIAIYSQGGLTYRFQKTTDNRWRVSIAFKGAFEFVKTFERPEAAPMTGEALFKDYINSEAPGTL